MSENLTFEKNLTDYLEYRIGNYIWIYISPLLIILGTFGNILSIAVLLRKSMRSSVTMFYLTVLSFADLFTLYTGLLRYWIRTLNDVDIRTFSDAGCKIHTFLVYLSLDLTVWILVAVTLDRWLSVSLPFKAKRICSLKMSRIFVIVILIGLVLKNMHFFWTVELVQTWEFRCDAGTESADNFINFVWPWIDFSTFCLIPFTIMILCNIRIIYEMITSQRKIAANISPQKPKYLSQISNPGPSENSSVLPQNGSYRKKATLSTLSDTQQKIQVRRISSLTAMLLTVNCVFLITTFPIQLFLIMEEYWYPTENRTNEDRASFNLGWAIVNVVQYSNNAIHFFLYCLTGPRFRHELKCMFKRNNQISCNFEPSHTLEH